MAMLWCLSSLQKELGIHVSAAHFNHGLRGEEADRDERFVVRFCAEHEIELFTGRADVAEFAAQSANLQGNAEAGSGGKGPANAKSLF